MRARSVRLLLVVGVVVAIGAIVGTSASGGTGRRTPELVAILGAFRRPQTPADRAIPWQKYAILSNSPLRSADTPVRSLVRLAASPPGAGKVYLVPMRPPGQGDSNANLTLGMFGAVGECCDTAARIKADGMGTPTSRSNQLVLVVPDGVAKVAIIGSHQTPGTVHNNVVVFTTPPYVTFRFIWYGTSGAVIKRTG